MADVEFSFEENTVKILKVTEDSIEAALLEAAAEIVSQTAQNTRVDTGQLKGSWKANVSKTANGYEAVIGSPLENAIWEEFGTGEQSITGKGRKNWHGKSASRAFWKAYIKTKPKIQKHFEEKFNAVFK